MTKTDTTDVDGTIRQIEEMTKAGCSNPRLQVAVSFADRGTKNPDYKIEGEFFDCYSPKTNNPRNIVDTVSGKVGTGQANRVVLNLADSDVPLDALKKQLADSPIQNLEELMALTKDGKLIQLFP